MDSPTSSKENQLSVRGGLTGYHLPCSSEHLPGTGWKESFQTFCLFFKFFYFTLCDFIYKMRLNSYLMRFWKPKMRCYCKILHWCPLLVKALFIDEKVVSSVSWSLLLVLIHPLPAHPPAPPPPSYSPSSRSSSLFVLLPFLFLLLLLRLSLLHLVSIFLSLSPSSGCFLPISRIWKGKPIS